MLEESFKLLPNDDELQTALSRVFMHDLEKEESVIITNRRTNEYSSSHPSEIVELAFSGGKKILFVKYEIQGVVLENDHHKSLEYEIEIYKTILSNIGMTIPEYYGNFVYEKKMTRLLILKYIDNLIFFNKSKDPKTIFQAVEWLSEFHNRSKVFLSKRECSFLHKYSEDYFVQWPNEIIDNIVEAHLEKKYKWLRDICNRFKAEISSLTNADSVVVHGEFYAANVLYKSGIFYPIDWQTAAIGAGEIDLASLTEGWKEEIKEKCFKHYYKNRKLKESVSLSKKRFMLSEMYFHLMWMTKKNIKDINKNYWRSIRLVSLYKDLINF